MLNRGTVDAVLSSLDNAQEVAKHIRNSGFVLDKQDLKRILADLTASVTETKMELSILQDVIVKKDKELMRLHEASFYRGNVRRRGDGYYKTLDGRPYGQAYCSYCWEKDHQLYHLHNRILNKEVRICPHCKNEYQAMRTPYLEAEKMAV